LEALLQLLKEALLYRLILGGSVCSEYITRKHTRKRLLGIHLLAIRFHALYSPASRPVTLQLRGLL